MASSLSLSLSLLFKALGSLPPSFRGRSHAIMGESSACHTHHFLFNGTGPVSSGGEKRVGTAAAAAQVKINCKFSERETSQRRARLARLDSGLPEEALYVFH